MPIAEYLTGPQAKGAIELADEEKTYNVRIVMGEPVRAEEKELATDLHGQHGQS